MGSPPERAVVELNAAFRSLSEQIGKVIVGQQEVVEQLLIGLFSRGHCLLVGVPGLAKTLLVSSLAKILDLSFKRIQFTPDLMPADITGTDLLQDDPETHRRKFVFLPGPLFANMILADEINRTPPKTQAALLEAMGEGQVSVDGQTRKLPEPFIVLATDNPIEYEGTYELPEAQLDRFLMRLRMGYLTTSDETAMLRRRVDRAGDYVQLSPVTSPEGVLAMRKSLEQVEITADLLDYVVAIVTATRHNPQVQVGASSRGGLALVQLARGQALLNQRDYVVPDDIKQVAVSALAHRITLRPELWVRQVSSDDVMTKLLSAVPTPKTDPAARAGGRGQTRAVAG